MREYKKIGIYIICILLIITLSGCRSKKKYGNPEIPGKFVFNGERGKDRVMRLYLMKDSKIRNIGEKGFAPRFSPDGKKIAVFEGNELFLYDGEGNFLKSIKIKYKQFFGNDWTTNSKNLIYGCKEDIETDVYMPAGLYNDYLMKIDIETGEETIIKKYPNVDIGFMIRNIFVSANNKRIVADIGSSSGTSYIYIMDIDGKNERRLWKTADPLGWFPDNKHILFITNRDSEGRSINSAWGRMYKMNVDTGEIETIEETVKYFYTGERLSKDGKYIYYSKPMNGGRQIMICPLGPRDEDKEIAVTYSYFISGDAGYSQDTNPDWHIDSEQ